MDFKNLVIKQAKQLGIVTLEAVGKAILDIVKDIRSDAEKDKSQKPDVTL